jgi:hypothetical protein
MQKLDEESGFLIWDQDDWHAVDLTDLISRIDTGKCGYSRVDKDAAPENARRVFICGNHADGPEAGHFGCMNVDHPFVLMSVPVPPELTTEEEENEYAAAILDLFRLRYMKDEK